MNSILKDTFREIKKTKGRFFSILAIVLIGVGFFAGVWASAPIMRYSVDRYYDDYNLMDLRIVSNFGLTQDDMDRLAEIDGVKQLYGAYTKDFIGNINGESYVIKVSSYNSQQLKDGDYINKFNLVEGRLPENENEILFENVSDMQKSVELNQKITLSLPDEEAGDYLVNDTYTVVGLVQTPYYLSYEKGASDIGGGVCNYYMYIDEDNFNMDVYTEAFVTIEGAAEYNSYKDEYFDYIAPVKNAVEDLGYERSEIRGDEIIDSANEELDKAIQEYEDGKKTFDEEIEKAQKQLDDAENEILLGKAKLDSSELVLQGQIQSGKTQLETYSGIVDDLQKQYDDLNEQFQTTNGEAIKERDEIKRNIDQKQKELDEKKAAAADLYKLIDQFNRDMETEKAAVRRAEGKISENESRIAEIDLELAELDELSPEYRRLVQEKEQLTRENRQLQDEIRKRNETIDSINRQLDEIYASEEMTQISRLEDEIQRLQIEYDAINRSLSVRESSLKQMESQLNEAKAELKKQSDSLAKIEADGKRQIANGRAEIVKAEAELAEGKRTFEKEKADGQKELDDGYEEILKAQNEIRLIENAQWYVLDRNSHYSYVDYGGACDRMENIAVVFPVFFFLVAALVCLTTMTRLVDEQRQQIGTLKALGYSTGMIMSKYIIYAVLASLVGSILGLVCGILRFPYIIYTAWKLMYIVPGIKYELQIPLMIISVILSVAITAGATIRACYKELLATPSTLMRPKAPKMGKKILLEKITFIWNRLSFTLKVTFRNIFRYKKRMSMTIIGIAGCTSLLISGFGIKDSISDLVNIQFGQVTKYDGTASYDAGLSDDRTIELENFISSNNHVEEYMSVSLTSAILPDADGKSVTLMVTQDTSRFRNFVDLRTRKGHEPVTLDSSGAVISEKIANDYDINIGDEISVTNSDNFTAKVKISGIVENYVNHYIYMTGTYYSNVFGLRAKTNTFLMKLDDGSNSEAVSQYLNENEDISSVSFYSSFITSFEGMINSLNYIVLVLILSAGALAFVVLYNLTNVNISERQKEIATLKVLGFYPGEVKKYIYYENIFLTIIGGLVGLMLGKGLHLLIMVVVELDDIMFGRNIEPVSFVISFMLTVVFAMIVNQAMSKKLKNIQMVESLKSVE